MTPSPPPREVPHTDASRPLCASLDATSECSTWKRRRRRREPVVLVVAPEFPLAEPAADPTFQVPVATVEVDDPIAVLTTVTTPLGEVTVVVVAPDESLVVTFTVPSASVSVTSPVWGSVATEDFSTVTLPSAFVRVVVVSVLPAPSSFVWLVVPSDDFVLDTEVPSGAVTFDVLDVVVVPNRLVLEDVVDTFTEPSGSTVVMSMGVVLPSELTVTRTVVRVPSGSVSGEERIVPVVIPRAFLVTVTALPWASVVVTAVPDGTSCPNTVVIVVAVTVPSSPVTDTTLVGVAPGDA